MGSVAARVAGWQRRLGGQASPLGPVSAGSGESPSGAPVQVEILVDGLWTDITSRVMTRDGSFNIAITRGQPDEGTQTNPSGCRFQLNNRDGLFSPRCPTSPYYGKIGRNTPLRVSVPVGNDKSYRFWGEVSAWPPKWDITGTDVWVELEAAGILRRLGQGAAPIGSTLRLALTQANISDPIVGSNVLPVVAYWPMEDLSGATRIASALDGRYNMAITGTPTLATDRSFIASDPLPKIGDATFSGTVGAYGVPVGTQVSFLLVIPAGAAADGQRILSFSGTGTIRRWEVYYSTSASGSVGLRGYTSSGSLVVNLGPTGVPLNGVPAQVTVQLLQDGADVTATIESTPVVNPAASGDFGTAVGQTVGLVSAVTVAQDRGLTDTVIGHVRVQTATSQDELDSAIFDVLRQLAAYVGETADDRIYRLLLSFGVSYQQIGSIEDSVSMGAQLSATLLSLINDAVAADGGILFERTVAVGLGYRTGQSLENQSAALALSYSANQLAAVPEPVDDDQHTRNDIVVTRVGGSSARATLTSGPLSVLQPPAGAGRYDDAVTVNVESDDDLPDQAGWRLHLGTVDEARFPRVSVNLAHPTFVSNPALRAQALAVRPGDRITISSPPAWLPPDDISQLALGYTETIDQFRHHITWNCAPESPYRVAVFDDTVLGRLDTGGSVLSTDALSTATALNVLTTSGPLWTTDPAEMPISVRVAGEVMTVTAISGTTPGTAQVFTVVRSVNGVVKAQLAGADVRLDQPMIIALPGRFN